MADKTSTPFIRQQTILYQQGQGYFPVLGIYQKIIHYFKQRI